VTVLDASAVIAYLKDEPAADAIEPLVTGPSVISALNVAEIVDRMVRVAGRTAEDVETALIVMERGGLRIVPLTDDLGLHAGHLRARYYNRNKREVSMADCVAAATALSEKLPLATADPALVAVMRGEGGDVYELPDSRGVRS
jgi:PIN domain nuclease of toxin-antitoxin system